MKNRLENIIVAMIMLSAVIMLLTASAAFADTLTLPSGLKEIEDEAFMNAASLDTVIVPEGVSSIGSRAFSGTGISQLSLPASLEQIGTDAFSGCDDMTVTAPEGCWAYEWALKNGHLKGEKDSPTQVIFPETIQAGEDLTISIIGASNTVRHGVYLTNDRDQSRQYRAITKTSGQVIWEGYLLEPGTYHVTVYTVTDNFKSLNPVNYLFEVLGSKPDVTVLDFPESIPSSSSFYVNTDLIDNLFIETSFKDTTDNVFYPHVDYSEEEHRVFLSIYDDVFIQGIIYVNYSTKNNGVWSKTESITIQVTPQKGLEPPTITLPDEIQAGRDLLLSYNGIPNIKTCNVTLYKSDNPDRSIYYNWFQYNGSGEIVIPGYCLDNGTYDLYIEAHNSDAEDEYLRFGSKKYAFDVIGERTETIFEVDSDFVLYEYENIHFTVSCPSANRIAVKYYYQDGYNEIRIYYLDDDGKVYIAEYVDPDLEYITICAEQEGVYSSWSDPFYWSIIKKEALSAPRLIFPEILSAGENLEISWNDVPNAEYYYLTIEEAYSSRSELFHSSIPCEEKSLVIVPGYLFNQGYYRIHLSASAENYQESYSDYLCRVSGVRTNAPTVKPKQDTIRIQNKSVFLIDTEAGDLLRIECWITSSDGRYCGPTYTMNIVSDQTEWTYTPDEYMRNTTIDIKFAIYKDGIWSAWKTLSYTIEDIEQLSVPTIHINDTYQAGETIVLRFDAVENAQHYDWYLYQGSSDSWIKGDYKEINSTSLIYGYEIEPGNYKIRVTANSDGYRSNTSEKTFLVSGTKQPMNEVSVNKTHVSPGETFTFTIDTTNITSLRYRIIEQNDPSSINVLSNTTRFTTFCYPGDQLSYQFAGYMNGKWTAWSSPIIITADEEPTPVAPVVNVESSFLSGQDVTVSFESVNGASYYYVYLLDEQDNTIQSVYKSSVSPVTFFGYQLTPGNYVVRVRASSSGQSSSTDHAIQVITSTLSSAPEIVSAETESQAGSNVTFTINTTNSTKLAVRYYQDGYTNNLQYTNINTTDNSTIWRQMRYNPGEIWYYQFAVYQNEAWSEWTPWQEVHITEAE